MRPLAIMVAGVVAASPICANAPDSDKSSVESQAPVLDRTAIHQAVIDHERDPMGKDSEMILPILVAHFKGVDYLICGDVLGPLAESKKEAHTAVMWQIVFGSGDWVEQNPERARDVDAYTLAGLESGLRAYENILARKPKARFPLLDELLRRRNDGRLAEYVKEHPCREK
jgi:hypothetical protein